MLNKGFIKSQIFKFSANNYPKKGVNTSKFNKRINLIDKGLYKSKKIGEVVETTKETQTQLRSQMGKLVFELISKQKHEKNIAFEDYKNNQFNSITNQREENFLNYEQNNNLDFININKKTNSHESKYSVDLSENNNESKNELDDIIAAEM